MYFNWQKEKHVPQKPTFRYGIVKYGFALVTDEKRFAHSIIYTIILFFWLFNRTKNKTVTAQNTMTVLTI